MKHLNEIELVMALDGEMEAPELALARTHVSECAPCAAKFEALQQVSARVVEYQQSLYSAKPLAADVPRSTQIESEHFFRTWSWGLAAAAAMAVIAVGIAVVERSNESSDKSSKATARSFVAKNAPQDDGAFRIANSTAVNNIQGKRAKAVNNIQGKRAKLKAHTLKAHAKTAPAAKPERQLAFMELPFSDASLPLTDATVVRVQLPASALRQAGVPVEEDSANAMLQADVVLGLDGLPRGIRLVKNTSTVIGTN